MKKIEVVIGGDEPLPPHYQPHREGAAHTVERPCLGQVEEAAQHLLRLLAPPDTSGGGGRVPTIAAGELDRIDQLCDGLSRVYYWAVEEATTFSEEPSQLAACGVPEIVVRCVCCKRPRIIAAALRCFRFLLGHWQSQSEVRRLCKEFFFHHTDDSLSGEGAVLALVLSAVESHGGIVELVVAAIEAVRVMVEGSEEAFVKVVLESSAVSYVLSSLSRHEESTEVAVAAAQFLVALVEKEIPDAEYPTASLFCHVGTVVPSLVKALRCHPHSYPLQAAYFQFVREAAQYPENLSPLLDHGVYPPLAGALPHLLHKPSLFECDVEAIGYFIPRLDLFQQRSLFLLLKRTLVERAELEVQLYSVALLYSLITQVARVTVEEGARGADPYAAYALYAAPLEEKEAVTENKSTPVVTLQKSDTVSFVSWKDMGAFLRTICLPQVLMNLIEFYQRELRSLSIGEEEENTVKRLTTVASVSLQQIMLL